MTFPVQSRGRLDFVELARCEPHGTRDALWVGGARAAWFTSFSHALKISVLQKLPSPGRVVATQQLGGGVNSNPETAWVIVHDGSGGTWTVFADGSRTRWIPEADA